MSRHIPADGTMSAGRILVFAGGVLPSLEAVRRLPVSGDGIVCADGGARHALALGLIPDVVIGDLDSLQPPERLRLLAGHVEIRQRPRDKDETDLELALNCALERDPAAIVIVGALGGRLDHTLGNIALLGDARLEGRSCCLDDGIERVFLCRDTTEIHGERGDLVSLVPWGVPVLGVRTEGLRWPLNDESLLPERSRGISNEMLGDTARVLIGSGWMLIVHRRVDQVAESL
jgi:thiamine pyrophosphokinase